MNCRTDGAVYEINIGHGVVSCKVYLPPTVKARLDHREMTALRKKIHDAMEDVLAPFFPQFPPLSASEPAGASSEVKKLRAVLRSVDDFFKIDEANGDDALWTPEYTAMIEAVREVLNGYPFTTRQEVKWGV